MRHFKHKFLLGLIPAVALFGLLLTSAKDATPRHQVTEKLEANSSSELYRFNHSDDEMTLLFNASPRVYRNASRETLTTLKNELTDAVKEIAQSQIDLVDRFSSQHNGRAKSNRNVLRANSGTYVSPIVLLENILVEQFVVDGVTRASAVIDYAEGSNEAYANLTSYFIDKYVDEQLSSNPGSTEQVLVESACNQLGADLQQYVTEVYTDRGEAVPNLSERIYQHYGASVIGVSFVPTVTDITEIYSVVQEALDDTTVTIPNIVTSLGEDSVSDDVKTVLSSPTTTSDGLKDLFLAVEPEVLGELVECTNITSDEMMQAIKTLGTSALIEVADSISIDGLKEITSKVSGLTKDELTQFIIDNVTAGDLVKAIKSVRIDGTLILENKEIKLRGVEKVLRSLPKPGVIANYSDDQMRLSYNIELGTSIGDVHFDLTVGLFGNCDHIRQLAKYIADIVKFEKIDGVYHLTITAPDKLYKLYSWLCNNPAFGDDLKLEIVETMFSSIRDLEEYVRNKTVESLAENLKDIDYEAILDTILSAEEWNELLGKSFVTDARIDKAIDMFFELVSKASKITYDRVYDFINRYIDLSKYNDSQVRNLAEKLINFIKKVDARHYDSELFRKLIDPTDGTYNNDWVYDNIDQIATNRSALYARIQRFALKLFDKIPDRFKDHSLMEYYAGDSRFEYNKGVTLNYTALLDLGKRFIPNKIYDTAKKYLEKLPTYVDVDINVTIPHVHSVTYVLDELGGSEEETKVIALPLSANVPFFANMTEIDGKQIVKWVDAANNEVTDMPDEDITVYPVFDYQVEVYPTSIDKIYDGTGDITASVNIPGTYEYSWYKVTATGDELVGTEAKLPVVHVDDSGTYYCKVVTPAGELESVQVPVKIDPLEVDYGTMDWSTNTFEYDGNAHGVYLKDIPELISVKYSIDGGTPADEYPTKVDAGDYQTTAHLDVKDSDHCLPATPFEKPTADWKISPKAISVAGVSWSTPSTFTYEPGVERTLKLENLPEHVHAKYTCGGEETTDVGVTRVNAGQYPIEVQLYADANYSLLNDGTFATSITLTIAKADIPADAFIFESTTSYEYDGNTHRPELIANPTYGTTYSAMVESITYDANTPAQKEPGNYSVKATVALSATYAANYALSQEIYETSFTITKVIVSIPDLTFADSVVTYTGSAQYIKLKKAADGSEFSGDSHLAVTYSYEGNTAGVQGKTDVGTYLVTADVALTDAAHYELDTASQSKTHYEANLKINPATIPTSSFNFAVDSTTYTYDGNSHIPTLSGYPTDLVAIQSTVVTPNANPTNAGTYHVIYTLVSTNPNYVIPEGYDTYQVDYTIEKATIAAPTITWNYTGPFTYTGNNFSVDITNTLPEGVTATRTGTWTASAVGEYHAIIDLSLDAQHAVNYTLTGTTHAELSWEIVASLTYHFESTQTQGGLPVAVVDSTVGIPGDPHLSITEKTISVLSIDFSDYFDTETRDVKLIKGYEIKFVDNNEQEVDVNGHGAKFTVKILIDSSIDLTGAKFFHLTSATTVEEVQFVKNGNYIVFETEHFSDYALVNSVEKPPVPVNVYTVTFDANGGSGTMNPLELEEGTEMILPSNGFTAPEGQEFKCWSINGTEYKPGDKVTVTSDLTVKAVWKDIDRPQPPVEPTIQDANQNVAAIILITGSALVMLGGFLVILLIAKKKRGQ